MESGSQAAARRIADRFELAVRYAGSWDEYGVETWRAVDTVLARELRAILIPNDHPYRTEALDAARRAGLFEDAGVTRVLFVADEPESSVIFTEFPLGRSLASLIGGDTTHDMNLDITAELLPESIVTAIFGETTSAINHARNRGLRHLQLSARHIYISDSGEVTIDGIAVLNALAGVNTDRLSAELDRDEARGLIVFFAALLHGEDFPADPSSHNDYVQRACNLPDLPQRVRDVFQQERDGHGAQSPADLLRMLVPWGSVDPQNIPGFSNNPEDSEGNHERDIQENSGADTAETPSAPDTDAAVLGEADAHPQLSPQWPSVFETVSTDAVFTSFGTPHTDEPAPHALLPENEPPKSDETDAGAHDADAHDETADPKSEAIESSAAQLNSQPDSKFDSYSDAQLIAETEHGEPEENSESEEFDAADTSHIGYFADLEGTEDEEDEETFEEDSSLEFTSETLVNVGGKSFPVANVVLILFALAVLVALIAGIAKLFAPLDPVQITPRTDAAAYHSQIIRASAADALHREAPELLNLQYNDN